VAEEELAEPVDPVQAPDEAAPEQEGEEMRLSLLRLRIPDSSASNGRRLRNFLPLLYSVVLTARHGCGSR